MLEKYESRQQQIRKPAQMIYTALADFNNFTPMVAGKVDDWTVDGDECSFRVKGMPVSLRMVEKRPGESIKIVASDSSPFGFTFWVQMKQVGPVGAAPGTEPDADEDSASDGVASIAAEPDDCGVAEPDDCGVAEPDTRIRLVLHAEMNMMIKMMIGSKIQPALDGMAEQIAVAFNAV